MLASSQRTLRSGTSGRPSHNSYEQVSTITTAGRPTTRRYSFYVSQLSAEGTVLEGGEETVLLRDGSIIGTALPADQRRSGTELLL